MHTRIIDALERKGDRLAAAQAQGRVGALMAVETPPGVVVEPREDNMPVTLEAGPDNCRKVFIRKEVNIGRKLFL